MCKKLLYDMHLKWQTLFEHPFKNHLIYIIYKYFLFYFILLHSTLSPLNFISRKGAKVQNEFLAFLAAFA
ncbi:hypothetical protein BGP_2998 [Beggiatoa sp. PS]|nr:hypothetical protein BGP_2998 [Beggiatoa sp. PS]